MLTLFAIVMSFGPHIHAQGRVIVDPNLYTLFYGFVPGFDGLRVPGDRVGANRVLDLREQNGRDVDGHDGRGFLFGLVPAGDERDERKHGRVRAT